MSEKERLYIVVTILLRTCFEGGGLPWRSGMEGREVVFLVPAARWRPVAGRSRTGWYWWLRWWTELSQRMERRPVRVAVCLGERVSCVVVDGKHGSCSGLSDTVRHSELPEHLCSGQLDGLLGEGLVACQCGRGSYSTAVESLATGSNWYGSTVSSTLEIIIPFFFAIILFFTAHILLLLFLHFSSIILKLSSKQSQFSNTYND